MCDQYMGIRLLGGNRLTKLASACHASWGIYGHDMSAMFTLCGRQKSTINQYA